MQELLDYRFRSHGNGEMVNWFAVRVAGENAISGNGKDKQHKMTRVPRDWDLVGP